MKKTPLSVALLVSIVLGIVVGLGLGVSLTGCEPAPMLPPTGMQIRVLVTDGVDLTGWLPEDRETIRLALMRMNATGDQWVRVEGGEHELVLRTFAAENSSHLGGRYDRRTRIAEVDPAQTHGSWRQLAIEHELMHGKTDLARNHILHVCERPGQSDDCHPTIFGTAVLNPFLPEEGNPWDDTYGPPRTELYQADLDAITQPLETRP